MELVFSRTAGPCYGVRRAVRMIRQHLARHGAGSVVSVGPVVDEPAVMRELAVHGLMIVDEVGDIKTGQVVALPVCGGNRDLERRVKDREGVPLVTVCPRLVRTRDLAYRLALDGYPVLVVGNSDTTESAAILDRAEAGWKEQFASLATHHGRVFAGALVDHGDRLDEQVPEDVSHVAVLARPTGTFEEYGHVVLAALERFEEVRAYPTLCRSLRNRYLEARRLAERCDTILVVGRTVMDMDGFVRDMGEAGVRVVQIDGLEDVGTLDLTDVRSLGVVSSCLTLQSTLVTTVERLRKRLGGTLTTA